MRSIAGELETVPEEQLVPGPLAGLLFGSPRRFMNDLAMQLRLRAALELLHAAAECRLGGDQDFREPLRTFLQAAEIWQRQHGYQNNWYDPRMFQALQKLNDPAVNAVLAIRYDSPVEPGNTPFEQVKLNLRRSEDYTPALLGAMREALLRLGAVPAA